MGSHLGLQRCRGQVLNAQRQHGALGVGPYVAYVARTVEAATTAADLELGAVSESRDDAAEFGIAVVAVEHDVERGGLSELEDAAPEDGETVLSEVLAPTLGRESVEAEEQAVITYRAGRR